MHKCEQCGESRRGQKPLAACVAACSIHSHQPSANRPSTNQPPAQDRSIEPALTPRFSSSARQRAGSASKM